MLVLNNNKNIDKLAHIKARKASKPYKGYTPRSGVWCNIISEIRNNLENRYHEDYLHKIELKLSR